MKDDNDPAIERHCYQYPALKVLQHDVLHVGAGDSAKRLRQDADDLIKVRYLN